MSMKKTLFNIVNAVLAVLLLSSCDACKEDPYAKITYKVVCSEELLKYATPKVIYKGTTITIPESDWTNVTDGSLKIGDVNVHLKQWNYQVTYDDFGVVDDEMTVRYEPKNNFTDAIQSNINLFSHNLSANVEIEDNDENTHHYSFNKTNISIGNSTSIEDVLKPDYLGLHIESNGTCIEKKK